MSEAHTSHTNSILGEIGREFNAPVFPHSPAARAMVYSATLFIILVEGFKAPFAASLGVAAALALLIYAVHASAQHPWLRRALWISASATVGILGLLCLASAAYVWPAKPWLFVAAGSNFWVAVDLYQESRKVSRAVPLGDGSAGREG